MGYFKPNSKKAIKLAIALKGLTAALAAMSFVTAKPQLFIAVLIVGAIANEAINFFSDATKEAEKDVTTPEL